MRIIIVIAIAFAVSTLAFAGDSVYNRNKTLDANGWSTYGTDEDVDLASDLVASPNTFAQLAAEDTIEVVGTVVGRVVTVSGIDSNGDQFSEAITTTGGTYGATSTTTARYIEGAVINSDTDSTVVIRRQTGNTFITSITPGQLSTKISQKFNGEKKAFVTGWGVHNGIASDSTTSATANLMATLRWYSDDADCLDNADGYQVVDSIYTNTNKPGDYRKLPNPVQLDPGGWLAVFVDCKDADQKATARIEGYDQ